MVRVKKKLYKVSLVFFSFLLFVFYIPVFSSPSFALVDPASMAIAGIADAFGMTYGVGSMFSGFESSDDAADAFASTWGDYNDFRVSQGQSSLSLDDVYELVLNSSPLSTVKDAYITGSRLYALTLNSDVQQALAGYWDFILSGPAEMVKVDNQYYEFQNKSNQPGWESISFYQIEGGTVNSIPVTVLPYSGSTAQANNRVHDLTVTATNGSAYMFYLDRVGVGPQLYFLSDSSFKISVVDLNTSSNNSTSYTVNGSSYHGFYLGYVAVGQNHYPGIPIIGSVPNSLTQDQTKAFILDAFGVSDGGTLSYSSAGGTLYVTPYNSLDGHVAIPSPAELVDAPPMTITLDVPANPAYPPAIPPMYYPEIFEGFFDRLLDGTLDIADTITVQPTPDPEDPEASPYPDVILPLVPVTLPSFNFSFGSIWHYVREWVSSLGAWFTLVFSVWASLPYAIVVPVYATAVIVIVLGVYKRFFM